MASELESGNVFDELYRRVYITARASFCAARRLERQSRWSQWTVALASVALIIIPLAQSTGLPSSLNNNTLNVLEIFLAIVVLVFSLLIGAENYLVRAAKMQQRGNELAKMYYALEPYRVKSGNAKKYENFYREYDSILSKFENHLPIDYDEHRLIKRKDFYPTNKEYIPAWISFKLRQVLSSLPYLLLLISCFYLVLILLLPSLKAL